MRSAFKLALSAAFILFFSAACESEDSDAIFLRLLTREGWNVDKVQRDHQLTSEFDNMELLFSATDYTTKGCDNSVWPKKGEYQREDPSSNVLIRDDQNELFISELDERHLVICFDFRTFEPITGRTKTTFYSFTFIHQ